MNAFIADLSDEDLFKLAVEERNQEAFLALFSRYWKDLYIKALTRLRDDQDAKDCVQDVFYNIVKRDNGIALPKNVSAYMHASIRNAVLNQIKSKVARLAREHEYATALPNDSAENTDMEYEELQYLVDETVRGMPAQMRQIFHLSRHEQLSGAEIAEQLGISHQYVRNQISMALRRLRTLIKPYGLE